MNNVINLLDVKINKQQDQIDVNYKIERKALNSKEIHNEMVKGYLKMLSNVSDVTA
ncbi:hypothetical protein [Metabacillus fastidiosus]|uniref:hypothetical protein n=1 Tax=Metabacillus fastidiosus TaxID=1458 RepID=UPI003D2CAB6E